MQYHPKIIMGLGLSLLLLGTTTFVLGAVLRGMFPFRYHLIGAPIWSGMITILTALLALLAARVKARNDDTHVGLYMLAGSMPIAVVISILASFFCVMLSVSAVLCDPLDIYKGNCGDPRDQTELGLLYTVLVLSALIVCVDLGLGFHTCDLQRDKEDPNVMAMNNM
ncbi:uncharacterized protein LOC118421630 [Branchiostoma floridae]|uniref:Uncharacterized protein LOC118421630 n=1 Tax=Branchiostoma floridae TaxID=7739 RepID=C3Z9F2_BRAFL|nr:uncharacterized protein LOC118421630 [Branchiostoma floridae]XP_035684893.1 uncharacterized protein LOC118421630 [Branchiostoma floridae]|eukprot:XP_002594870.1 hypothetical protein BRAFLDRAFT_124452 [Branchiostoma floridae]